MMRPNTDPTVKSSVKPKELKVEDALHYLDQVKMEFSDKPTIYNEFLEIMKSFKAESINTPGVIARVKALFRGYNKLILGFNTFLPEGEGYKIELTPEEEATAFPGHQITPTAPPQSVSAVEGAPSLVTSPSAVPAGATGTSPVVVEPSKPADTSVSVAMNAAGDATAGSSGENPSSTIAVAGADAAAATGAASTTGATPANQQGLTAQQLQQQHAIIYVTTIRNRFHNEPDTYRSFLKILHTYQKEQRGIKDVLEQVSQLFADHSDLLMEFTYFLPDAVQDQAKERLQRAVKESELRAKMTSNGQRPPPHLLPGAGNMFPPGPPARPPLHNASLPKGTGNKRSRNNQNSIPPGATRLPKQAGASPYMMNANKAMMNGNGEVYYPMGFPGSGQPGPGMQDPRAMHIGAGRGSGARRPPMGYSPSGSRHTFAPGGVGPNGHRGQDMAPQKEVTAAAPYHTLSAEKRFFDQVKKVLSGVSKNAWNEFVKCMELCCAEIITPKEMLDLSQGIFGNTGAGLFEELRIMMTNKYSYDTSISAQEPWYGIPLSEMDFSQSKKCTPSYRQLPRQYAKVFCSERAEMADSMIFNDDWVSVPIGSEDSCTFKHMRKNQYEEALFRSEDERFEMDMMIDSNLCTIRLLEPLVAEINHWDEARKAVQEEKGEAAAADGSEAVVKREDAAAAEVKLKKFPFQLEKKNITTIHLNCISRIYGKHGNEILELLHTHPGTIPVVLDRLKQKDVEWRKARQDLCPLWNDMISKNHNKSLDHRSFYFKQHDKRFYSATKLLADLKDSDIHLTMPYPTVQQITKQEELLKQPGITFAVPVEAMPQLAGKLEDMIPGLCMSYPHSAHGIHKDIYQILTHATESSNITPFAKERMRSMWRDLWRVFFNIPVQYIYDKAVIEKSEKSETTASTAHVQWEIDTKVITIHGSGNIVSYDDQKKTYMVRLRVSPEDPKEMSAEAVLGAEELSAGALQAICVTRTPGVPAGTEDIISHMMPLRDLIVEHEKTMQTMHQQPDQADHSYSAAECMASGKPLEEGAQCFFGTQMCYIFLRLHQALYSRLQIARDLAAAARKNTVAMRQRTGSTLSIYDETMASPSTRNLNSNKDVDSTSSAGSPYKKACTVEGEEDQKVGTAGPEDAANNIYLSFLSQVNAIVDGSTDHTKYEETTRQLLGNNSYVLFTIDKIIQQTVKCLNVMAMDETVMKLVGLFVYHRSLSGGVVPKVYQTHVAQILVNSNEEVYRLQCLSTHKPSNDHDSTGCCDQFDEEAPPTNACADSSVVACAILGHLHVPQSVASLLSAEREDEGTGKTAVWFSGEGGVGAGVGSPRSGGINASPAVHNVGTPRGAPAPLMLDDAEEEDDEHNTIVLAGGISSVQKEINSSPSDEEDSNETDSDEDYSDTEDENDGAAAVELLQAITGIGAADTEPVEESDLVIDLPKDNTLKRRRGMGSLSLFTANPAASQPSEDDMEVEVAEEVEEECEGERVVSSSNASAVSFQSSQESTPTEVESSSAPLKDIKKRSSRPTRLSR